MRMLLLIPILFAGLQAQANGDAGCGLGNMVFTDNAKLTQSAVATTNQIGSQTLAITTGTCGCASQGLVMREKEIQYFAEANQQDLGREMAQGSGEKLEVLAQLHGCQGDATSQFARMTQQNLSHILPTADTSAVQMVQGLKQQLKQNPEVARACSIQI